MWIRVGDRSVEGTHETHKAVLSPLNPHTPPQVTGVFKFGTVCVDRSTKPRSPVCDTTRERQGVLRWSPDLEASRETNCDVDYIWSKVYFSRN